MLAIWTNARSKKKPPTSGGFQGFWGALQYLDFRGLGAFLAFSGDEAHALVFFERLVARTLNSREVSEEIFATAVRSNKTEAFFRVEPLYDTGFHLSFLINILIASGEKIRIKRNAAVRDNTRSSVLCNLHMKHKFKQT